ncbi:MAG TPA: four helix bundle protein [Thermomicrobiales bacterium]|jgi:four helix bundle protein
MERSGDYTELVVWQRAMDFVDAVYDATEGWPRREEFGLSNQVRRAVVSVRANIAEGKGRTGTREYAHHLSIAHGSLWEVETLLRVGARRKFLEQTALDALLLQSREVSWLLRALIGRLK